MIFVTNHKAAEVLQPGKKTLNFPATGVTAKLTAVLGGGLFAIVFMWRNKFNITFICKTFVERITVVGFVADNMCGKMFQKTRIKRLFHKCHFVRASTSRVDGDRKTASVCKAHNFGAFPAFGLAHAIAPFFAGANVPSIKPSLKSIFPRSAKSSASSASILSNTPAFFHCWKRRWQVLRGGYRSGRSFQGAPVRRIQSMAFSTALESCVGRPDFPVPDFGGGICFLKRSHCAFVTSINLYYQEILRNKREVLG